MIRSFFIVLIFAVLYGCAMTPESVSRITDQNKLIDIAKNNEKLDVRRAAIGKISDQSILENFALNDSDWGIRNQAVGRIKSQKVLANISKNDSDFRVRSKAVGRLKDQNDILEIARNDENEKIVTIAIKKINVNTIRSQHVEQEMLFRIVNLTNDKDAKKSAFIKIQDPSIRKKIVRNNSDLDFINFVIAEDANKMVRSAAEYERPALVKKDIKNKFFALLPRLSWDQKEMAWNAWIMAQSFVVQSCAEVGKPVRLTKSGNNISLSCR